jgi:hypothetical protein
MKQVHESRIPASTIEIYERLSRRGEAREAVTEQNVADLIKLADRDGHTVLAQELREWRANRPPEDEAPAGEP